MLDYHSTFRPRVFRLSHSLRLETRDIYSKVQTPIPHLKYHQDVCIGYYILEIAFQSGPCKSVTHAVELINCISQLYFEYHAHPLISTQPIQQAEQLVPFYKLFIILYALHQDLRLYVMAVALHWSFCFSRSRAVI